MALSVFNEDYKKTVNRLKKQKVTVDAIIADPPYNVSRDYQLGFSNMGRSGMNYGAWDYNFNQKKWIDDVAPLVKSGGAFIIFNDWKNMGDIARQLEKNGFVVKDLLRWVKKNPMPRNIDRRYVTDCEYAIWAVKSGNKWTFNNLNDEGYLKPEFKTSVVAGGKNRLHPTQKSLELIKTIVSIHTNEGDLVFDPFLGSGTTALACKELNRNFVGSEIDPNYYEICMERIKND